MIGKFIYVMSEDGYKQFAEKGFKLIKYDKRNNVWVFENDSSQMTFDITCPHVVSDTLTF